jgi:hypothetical protein
MLLLPLCDGFRHVAVLVEHQLHKLLLRTSRQMRAGVPMHTREPTAGASGRMAGASGRTAARVAARKRGRADGAGASSTRGLSSEATRQTQGQRR